MKKSLQIILLFGLISFLGDVIYEGARSVNGPFLQILGLSAAAVGSIIGIGELLGYALRLITGFIIDRKNAHWVFLFIGYGLIAAIPMLSTAGTWQFAALFIIAERVGKGIRAPARDTIISSVSKNVGTGLSFGIHEAMDQAGALTGPLIFAALFAFTGLNNGDLASYTGAYKYFWIPFIVLILVIIIIFFRAPKLEEFEAPEKKEKEKIPPLFWIYAVFTFLAAAGFINFAIIGYHFKLKGILADAMIPVYYAVAMAADGVFALAVGKLYDFMKVKTGKKHGGMYVLILIPVVSIIVPFILFTAGRAAVLASAILWGLVMATHETIMRSTIADITPLHKRGSGYGIFSVVYGLALFTGGAGAGLLYDISIPALVTGIIIVQAAAVGTFIFLNKKIT